METDIRQIRNNTARTVHLDKVPCLALESECSYSDLGDCEIRSLETITVFSFFFPRESRVLVPGVG